MTNTVGRIGDMHPKRALNLHVQEDGDIIVWIGEPIFLQNQPIENTSVEFCTIGMGGGKSPKTLDALRTLVKAMEEDNK